MNILADIPHDGVAVFLYIILALCLGLVWRTGRDREGQPSHERSK